MHSESHAQQRTGMAQSVLHEIALALTQLAESGAPNAIDLRSLPMTEADRLELQEVLGRGEVSASLDMAGKSDIWETRHAGVWWVRHSGSGDRIASETIEIAAIPDILMAHRDDIRAAAARLSAELAAAAPEPV
ncbi:MAG: hydrogenase expression/formation C-terminal domain-containing protein [Lysobacteraceae bacterium]